MSEQAEKRIKEFYDDYRYDKELAKTENPIPYETITQNPQFDYFKDLSDATIPYGKDEHYEQRGQRGEVARTKKNRLAEIHVKIDIHDFDGDTVKEWVYHNAGRLLADEELSEIVGSLERNHRVNSGNLSDAYAEIVSNSSYPDILLGHPKAIRDLTQQGEIVPDWDKIVNPADRTRHFKGYFRGIIRAYQSYKLDCLYMYEKANLGYARTDFHFGDTSNGQKRELTFEFLCTCRPFLNDQVAKISYPEK